MKLFFYVRDPSGNVQRAGAECAELPPEIAKVQMEYSKDGCQMAEDWEHDAQTIGAVNKQLVEVTEKLNAVLSKLSSGDATAE